MGSVRRDPRGRRWQARYWDPAGRQRTRTFDTKGEAGAHLRRMETEIDRGEWCDPALGRITFGAWADQWAATVVHVRPSTLDRDLGLVRNYLLPRFGATPLARITPLEVRAWVAELGADGRLAPASVRKIGQVLTKVLRAAVEAGLVARSPAAGVRLPAEGRREMRFLTPGEVATLAAAIDEHHRVLVWTGAYTGLRWGELAGLRVGRVDLLRRSLGVVEQLTEINGAFAYGPPKTAAGRRRVRLPAFLAGLLEDQLATRAQPAREGLVFPAPGGGPMRRANFRQRVWLPATRAAGLRGLRFHDLRHTAVALAIAQGAHPKAIQERLGHSSVVVTLDRYGHLFEGLDDAIADGLDAAFDRAERGHERNLASLPSTG